MKRRAILHVLPALGAMASIPLAAGCELLAPLDTINADPAGGDRPDGDADVSAEDGRSLEETTDGTPSDASVSTDGDVSMDPPSEAGDAGVSDTGDVGVSEAGDGSLDASEPTGDARDAAEAAPIDSGVPTITVRGTVMGYWHHPVPGVHVQLGVESTTTGPNGQFTFTGVTPPYDIGLAVRGRRVAAWLFKGLTRTDPTLQGTDALAASSTLTTYRFPNLPPQSSSDAGPVYRTLKIAFGSPDTTYDIDPFDLRFDQFRYDYGSWEGPYATVGNVHALLWEKPSDLAVSPTRYVSYDTQPLTLEANTHSSVDLDVSADAIAAEPVTGNIASFASNRRLDGYIRFDTGAIMPVVSIENSPAAFSMLMPKLAGATVSVTATTDVGFNAYGVARRDGISPGSPGIQLTVPQPVTLVPLEGDATNVSTNTTFQWSASPSVALLSVACRGATTDDPWTFFYVVTEDYRAKLPTWTGASAIPLPKNRYCMWSVEVHGAYPTVNDATGPDGMLDPSGVAGRGVLLGSKREDGSFTSSEISGLTTAP